jgi:hypothetical protein
MFQVLEPPAEYLEEDITSKDDQRVPPDALYMLQSIRYCTDYFRVIIHGLGVKEPLLSFGTVFPHLW